MPRLAFLLALVCLPSVSAYSEGAPESACANMIPGHGPEAQGLSTTPYTILVESGETNGGGSVNGKIFLSPSLSLVLSLSLPLSHTPLSLSPSLSLFSSLPQAPLISRRIVFFHAVTIKGATNEDKFKGFAVVAENEAGEKIGTLKAALPFQQQFVASICDGKVRLYQLASNELNEREREREREREEERNDEIERR